MAYKMIEVDARQLKEAIETQHGGTATLVQAVPVKETFDGKTVWDAIVQVFRIDGHPKARRAYAWSSPIEGSTKRRFFAATAPCRPASANLKPVSLPPPPLTACGWRGWA